MKKHLKLPLVCISLLLCPYVAFAQNGFSVKGTVHDENKEPLVGASIYSKDGKRWTIADTDGAFSLELKAATDTIVVSYVGCEEQTLAVKDRQQVKIVLKADAANTLDDVVVIAYGSAKKSDLTGSVATVKMDEVAKSPVSGIDQALQGRIAGVEITSTDGEPGSSTSIRIRGTRSITASNEPLIVVDGVMDAVTSLNEISTDDIATMSFLKDASSTAIYGSRGANGVIIITTKNGTTSKPTVNASARFGVSKLARDLDLMNKDEFLRYRNDWNWVSNYLDSGAGTTTTPMHYDSQSITTDTDWIDAITRVAPYQQYNVSLGVKTDKENTYYTSLNYINEQGIIKASGYQRLTFRYNSSHKLARWLTLGIKISGTYQDKDQNKAAIGGTNTTNGAIYLSPAIAPYDNTNPFVENSSLFNTPVATIENTIKNQKTFTNNNVLDFKIKPFKGFTIESQNSFTDQFVNDYRFVPSYMPAKTEGEGADAYRKSGTTLKLSTENTATYKTKFGRYHHFDAMLGYSASWKKYEYMSVEAEGLVSDEITWNNLNAIASKENYTVNSSVQEITRESVFARVNYDYKKKYYLTFTGRYDGCSNFADNNKWAFFPSVAVRWNAKEENFLKKAKWLTELSLRASAGRTGNDALDPYKSLAAYSTSTDSYIFGGTQGVMLYPSRVANPDLTWEKTDSYSIGLESSFFKNRLSVLFEYYYSYTSDLLLVIPTIQSTGYKNRYGNIGSTTNSGIELTISSRNIETRNFGWTTDFTLSHNDQMVKDIGAEAYVSVIDGCSGYMMYGYKPGYPLNSLWGFQYAGVVHTSEEYDRNQITHTYAYQSDLDRTRILGSPKYVDQNHDGVLSNEDLIYLGNADPIVSGGLQNTFIFGGFRFGFYFTYSLGGKIYNYSEQYAAGSYNHNQYRFMLDAWHPTRNPYSDIPRAGCAKSVYNNSSQVYDASYLRLKSVNLKYTFNFKQSVKWIKSLSLSLDAENLFIVTEYNGFDPDVSSGSENSALKRVDLNSYPKSTMYILGVQMSF